MLSEAAVVEALARAGIDAPPRFDDVTTSTQETAIQLARGGAPEWTLVAAGHQTEGRGRLDREWVDEPGSSLLFSVVLRPVAMEPADAGVLSLLAGSSMAIAASTLSGLAVRCKWPNDLRVRGRKVGGILATSEVSAASLAFVVIGIGVNLGGVPEEVADADALGLDPATLLERFAIEFRRAYAPGSDSFVADVLAEYRYWCETLGRRIRVETEETTIDGLAADLDERGALVVETADGRVAVGFGDVVHAD